TRGIKLFARLDIEADRHVGEGERACVVEQAEIVDALDVAKSDLLQVGAEEFEIQSGVVHVVFGGASTVDHPHHLKAAFAVERGVDEQAAKNIEVRHGNAQPAAGFEDPVDSDQRLRQIGIVSQMLKHVRGVDLGATRVVQERQVGA